MSQRFPSLSVCSSVRRKAILISLSLSRAFHDTIISSQESTPTSNGSHRYVRRSLRTGLFSNRSRTHTHIDFIRLQMSKSCNSVINSGKIFVQEFQYDESLFSIYLSLIVLFRKFLKCIYDVGELFTSDDITYKNLVKFSDYLREIQGLFSVNINRLTYTYEYLCSSQR